MVFVFHLLVPLIMDLHCALLMASLGSGLWSISHVPGPALGSEETELELPASWRGDTRTPTVTVLCGMCSA